MSIEKNEIVERYDHGLRQAADRARGLYRLGGSNKLWLSIAASLDTMRIDGLKMIDKKALTQAQSLEMFEKINGKSN